ncbi:MAG TPA: cache domain-containing protein, partial [Negativicutes bacterium]|nr:cache domain-containing protein [Negativicutes bacterium]
MKSIQTKLTVTILVIFLVALGALGGLNYWKARDIITQTITHDMSENTDTSAGDIADWLEARKSEIGFMAVAPVVMAGDKAAITPFLANAANANKQYDGIGYASPDGMYIASGGGTGSVSDREYFKHALQGEVVVSDPLLSKVTNHLITVVAYPVKVNGKVTGVLLGTVDMGGLSKKVLGIKVGQTGYAMVAQRDGLMIIHPDKELAMKYNALTDPKADPGRRAITERTAKGEKGLVTLTALGIDRYYSFAPVPGINWGLMITVPVSEVTGALTTLTWISLVTVVVVLVITAIFIAWFARRIAKPVQALEAAANRIAAGDISLTKLDITSNDEIGRLGNSFELMVRNLRTLVQKILGATEQVAASSEQLTASSEQSAQ